MVLGINTSDSKIIELFLERDNKIIRTKKIKAHKSQCEKLLPSIEKILINNSISLKSLKKIKVEHQGDSFTSLRIGILVANALAYALNIKVETFFFDKKYIKKNNNFNIIIPKYNRNIDIKIKKNEYF